MSKLAGVVRLLKKEQDRLANELRRIGAALAAFGKAYGRGRGTRSCRCQLGHGLRLPKERDGQKSERKRPNRTRSFQSGVSERSRHLREGRSPLRKERDGRR